MGHAMLRAMRSGGALCSGLARDFAAWPAFDARFADETECLIAVLLAIGTSHLLGIRNIGWAAFSAYMVIRPSLPESLRRGGLRSVGTAAGAALAGWLAPFLLNSTVYLSVALALGGGASLYLATLRPHGYGWWLLGLTFAMVLLDGMEHPAEAIGAFAQARLAEVTLGSGIAMLVSAGFKFARGGRTALVSVHTVQTVCAFSPPGRQRVALWHTLPGAIALALIPWVWRLFHLSALSQSSVTIMTVMLVPVAELAAPGHPASIRLCHRFLGCGFGGVLAIGLLLLAQHSPLLLTLALCAGVMVGRHIENGALDIRYVGTQFALAFLVVLVPDHYTGLSIWPGLERLSGVLLGMVLLEPLLLLFKRFAPASAR